MRTSNILTIGGAFVAILGGAFSLLMVKAFVSDKGQGFVDLSGLVVGGIVLAVGLALVAVGRKRARVETENDERNFSGLYLQTEWDATPRFHVLAGARLNHTVEKRTAGDRELS